jgi:hypothetical protein
MSDTYLLDRAAIADLVAKYGWAVDIRNWDLFRSIWKADAEWVYGGKTIAGVEDILKAAMESTGKRIYNHHLANDILIDFTGPDAATGLVHGQGVGGLADGSEFHCWVRYRDIYVRSGSGWLISRRELEMFPPSPVMVENDAIA